MGTAFFFGRRLRRASTGVQDRVAAAMGTADEAFSQIRTVQSFVREAEEMRRYGGLLDQRGGVGDRPGARSARLLFGVVGFVAFSGVVAVLWQGGQLVLEGALTPGALVKFLLYAITVAAAVGSLASLFGSYQEAVGAAQRVFELLGTAAHRRRAVRRPRGWRRRCAAPSRWRTCASATAPDLPETLADVSFTIAPGEVVALVGPSGAGKTTVASLIPRFWDVTSGRIALDGVDVRQLSFADLRGAIGLVPQEPALFSGSVRENIAYARPDAQRSGGARARRAPRTRTEFIERLPDGLDTHRRRARREAVGRPAPAHRARARLPQGPRRRRARRGHERAWTTRASGWWRTRWRSCCAAAAR